jgi:RNA polymerase sigma factor (sigma-70 family)
MTCLELPLSTYVIPLTDEELIATLQSGNAEQGLLGIEQRYGSRLLNFVHGVVRDQHLAQDLVQEVFEKVLYKHDLYQPGTNFRAWLFEIARNLALSALRQQKHLPRPVSALVHHADTEPQDLLANVADSHEDHALEETELMDAFRAAVADLPAHYRTVFELCVQEGLPYQEAGRQLGLPTGTVAIRIMRARKRLFGALQKHLGRLRRPPACFQN